MCDILITSELIFCKQNWAMLFGRQFGEEILWTFLQSRLVITLSSGGIFWDRLISEARYGIRYLFDIIIPRQSKGQAKFPKA